MLQKSFRAVGDSLLERVRISEMGSGRALGRNGDAMMHRKKVGGMVNL